MTQIKRRHVLLSKCEISLVSLLYRLFALKKKQADEILKKMQGEGWGEWLKRPFNYHYATSTSWR